MSGVYQLHLRLPHATTIAVGRLGTFRFPAGWYVYTGSAMNGLEARIRRHARREKKLHWHVDYLLQHALVRRVVTLECRSETSALESSGSPLLSECAWNERTLAQPGARVIVARFGSSDCRCISHLVYFGARKPPAFHKDRRKGTVAFRRQGNCGYVSPSEKILLRNQRGK